MKSVLAAIAYFALIYAASSWLNIKDHAEAEEMKRNGGWVLKAPSYARAHEKPAPFHRSRYVRYSINACLTAQGSRSKVITVAPDRERWAPAAN